MSSCPKGKLKRVIFGSTKSSCNKMKQQSGTQERQKVNKPSALLSQEENEQVFGLLGRKCQSMCTAIVQLYKTEGSAHSHWKKKYSGALCFVKDSCKRSYFMRLYCLMKTDLLWEHELYDNIKLNRARPYLLTFEGQDGYVALNFASEEECENYYRIADHTIDNRNRKRQERKSRPKSQNAPSAPLSQAPDVEDSSKVMLRNPRMASIQIAPTLNAAQLKSQSVASVPRERRRGQRRYTKADISTPTNFIHISHVGWDEQKGFDLTGNEDDELKHFFNKAGVSQQELNDRHTREFIYDFVKSYNVLESVKEEKNEKPKAPVPPPVPSRQTQNGNQRTAPPPPPTRQPPPPLPATTPPTRGPPPSRPPPINVTSVAAPPPPPPPPPPQPSIVPPPPPIISQESAVSAENKTTLPVVNDTRNALMESIRKGTTLKKVDPSSLSTSSGDSRSDLMSEIRQGFELRPASNRELPSASNRTSDNGGGTDALADALRRALQERGRVIHSSDEDSDESSENDGEWED